MATPAQTRLSTRPRKGPATRFLRLAGGPPTGERLGDVLRTAAGRWPGNTLLSRRNATQEHSSTFSEFLAEAERLAVGLLESGLQPGDRVALFADNCREWLAADQALTLAGLVSVPRGTDTAPAELELIVEHSDARAIIAQDTALVAKLTDKSRHGRQIWTLHHERGAVHQGLDGLIAAGEASIRSGDGRALLENAAAQIHGDSLCTIVYTSGTTGRPKGVMLTHDNITSNVRSASAVLGLRPGEKLLSILPSWHMFERVIEYVAIANGCSLVYTNQRLLKDDLTKEQPQVVAFVPRIWERLADGMQNKLGQLPSWKRRLLDAFHDLGENIASGEGGTLVRWMHRRLSRVLLKPLWTAMGGQLKLGVSGGGALPEEVDRFLLGLGLPLLNGYGLTETSPVLSVRLVAQNRVQSVGPPLPHTELRVVGSEGHDVSHGEIGEVIARGPQIMAGYYKDPELTRQIVNADGWLKTGDLGALDHDGWLSITGRCKDTIVLAGGENVEPEPIEGRIRASRYIDQVMLVGQDKKIIGALVVPDDDAFQKDGIDGHDRMRGTLREELDRLVSTEAGFRPVDRVGPFAIVEEGFTLENGCMTQTLKLRRHVISERCAATIDSLYAR